MLLAGWCTRCCGCRLILSALLGSHTDFMIRFQDSMWTVIPDEQTRPGVTGDGGH